MKKPSSVSSMKEIANILERGGFVASVEKIDHNGECCYCSVRYDQAEFQLNVNGETVHTLWDYGIRPCNCP